MATTGHIFLFAATLSALTACSGGSSEGEPTQWVHLSTAPNGDTFLVDKSSIRKNDGVIQVWTLVNLGASGERGANSEKTAFLVNCKTREFATLSGISYSEKDGQGHVLHTISAKRDEITYQLAAPETITDMLVTFSCRNSQ